VVLIFLVIASMVSTHEKLYDHEFYFHHFNSLCYLTGGFSGFFLLLTNIKTDWFKFDRRSVNEAAFLCLGFVFGAGTSGGLTLVSISIPVGVVIIFLDRFVSSSNVYRTLAFIYFSCVGAFLVGNKFDRPFDWWSSETVPISQTTRSVWDTNQGKRLQILNDILSKCEIKPLTLLAYPHMTMFNVVSKLSPHGKVVTYWLDYLSDEHAVQAHRELKIKGPDILIHWKMPQAVFDGHSKLFKHGASLVHQEISEYLLSPLFLMKYKRITVIQDAQNSYQVFAKEALGCPDANILKLR